MSAHDTEPALEELAEDVDAEELVDAEAEDLGDVTIEELADALEQCQAIAEYTSERCRLPAVDGTPYCPFHIGDLEPIDDPRDDESHETG